MNNNLEMLINENKINYLIENDLEYNSKETKVIKRFCEYFIKKIKLIELIDESTESKLISSQNDLFKIKSENKLLTQINNQSEQKLIKSEKELIKTKKELDLLKQLINELNEKPKKKEIIKELVIKQFGLVIIEEKKITLEI